MGEGVVERAGEREGEWVARERYEERSSGRSAATVR